MKHTGICGIDVINILRTISLAKSKSIPGSTDEGGIASRGQFAILSYLWIIRDYLSHGYYRSSEKGHRINGNGKVNWKKTLATQPIISSGSIIYSTLVVEVRNACDDLIAAAHRWCVFDSVRRIGWLFGLSEKSVFVPRTPASVIKRYIQAIKSELQRTFDDARKRRLTHMLMILTGVDGSDRTCEIVYGVDTYHYVYERMVDYLFGNTSDIAKFNPNAQWYLRKNAFVPTAATSLRPDTIRLEPFTNASAEGQKDAYVLDAKYYRFGTTGSERDLPTTASIQKQITYGDTVICHLRNTENIRCVYNAFILPYNKKCNCFGYTENLEYIGYSQGNWRSDGLSHTRICAFLLDTKHLVSVWAQGNCEDDITKLISEIAQAVK